MSRQFVSWRHHASVHLRARSRGLEGMMWPQQRICGHMDVFGVSENEHIPSNWSYTVSIGKPCTRRYSDCYDHFDHSIPFEMRLIIAHVIFVFSACS